MRHAVTAAILASSLTFAAPPAKGPARPAPKTPPPRTAPSPGAASSEESSKGLFKPLSKQFDSRDNPITPAKVELGKQLFFEARLSKNHDVSCNSCHDVAKYGVDGQQFSSGHRSQKGGRNSPSVYNAGLHVAQFWDGRAPTLEDQAKGPVLNPVEMAMSGPSAVEKVLQSIPGYAPLFKKAFPNDKQPITFDNMARAVGAFERTLVTPSKFDKYLAGDKKALSDAEKKGLALFVSTGCTMCHLGEGVGGGMYQKFGLLQPVQGLKDAGRIEVTRNEADRFFFKVPSLRNTAKTGPWFHDGSASTLEEAVRLMAKVQLNKELSSADTASLIAFLNTLTGELPKAALGAPKVLPAGPETPKPDPS